VVKYIGLTTFRPGIEWFGLELTQGVGNNNGTVQGLSYFSCPKGKGVFVQLNKIAIPCSGRKGHSAPRVERKPGAIDTGRNSKYKAASFSETTECGSFLEEKCEKLGAARAAVPRKAGPIETGRIDYDAANFRETGTSNAGESFLKEKLAKTKNTGKVKRKLGPRETGRINYNAANYRSTEVDGDSFLKERFSSNRVSSHATKHVVRKAGPREIGRSNYKAASFDYNGASGESFLKEKFPVNCTTE